MSFLFMQWASEMEIVHTSWAEWRYHDNPDFEPMLMMGIEMY